jgi:putative flippase GtrA
MSSKHPAASSAQLSPLAIATRFIALSGMGWLCDMATFTLLVKLAGWDASTSNIASSYVGVTFVWFASLNAVFQRAGGGRFLLIYWGFQFASILAYSHALGMLASALATWPQAAPFESYRAPSAKLLITPFNLVTNFMFMKALTGYMRPR